MFCWYILNISYSVFLSFSDLPAHRAQLHPTVISRGFHPIAARIIGRHWISCQCQDFYMKTFFRNQSIDWDHITYIFSSLMGVRVQPQLTVLCKKPWRHVGKGHCFHIAGKQINQSTNENPRNTPFPPKNPTWNQNDSNKF